MSSPQAGDIIAVSVKSAWLSKINWAQAVGMACTALAIFSGNKYSVPLDVQLEIVATIQGAVAVVTWVVKTWFTPTVTPASVAPAASPGTKPGGAIGS
jgi:hypothetical protein